MHARLSPRVNAGGDVLDRAESLEITPDVVTTFMTSRKVDGDEPPTVVAGALLAADVALDQCEPGRRDEGGGPSMG